MNIQERHERMMAKLRDIRRLIAKARRLAR